MTDEAPELKPVESMTRKQLEKEASEITDIKLHRPPGDLMDGGLRAAVRLARRRRLKSFRPSDE